MDQILFHLETIADEDLKEIVSSLNLCTNRSRDELITDIVQYYQYLEGRPTDTESEGAVTSATPQRRASVSTAASLSSNVDSSVVTRAMLRLDHPSCPRQSRRSTAPADRAAEASPPDPRINLRSVLRRWEAIGQLEERRRLSGSTDSSEDPIIIGRSSRGLSPRSADLVPEVEPSRPSTRGRPSGTLMDFEFRLRQSHPSTGRNSTQGTASPGHAMRRRSHENPPQPTTPQARTHSMTLRQRELPVVELEASDESPQRRSTRQSRQEIEVDVLPQPPRATQRTGRQSTARRSTLPDPSSSLTARRYEIVGRMPGEDTEIWLDVDDSEDSIPSVLADLFGAEEEEEEIADDGDYGLSVEDIRNNTVEGRFQTQKKAAAPSPKPASNSQSAPDTCPICIEEFVEKERIRTLPCFHIYHVRCIDRWLKRNAKCPICKHIVA